MDLTDLSEKSLDDLYVDLGRLLFGSAEFGGDDLRLMRGRAKQWMEANAEAVRERVCPCADEIGDAAVDIGAVADALSGLLHGPVAFTVAAIVVKIGVRKICQG